MKPSAEKRRQIEVNSRIFYWSLNHRYGNYWRDSEPPAIYILSHDEEFEVYYHLRQSSKGKPRIDIRRGVADIPAQVQTPCYVRVPVWDDEKPTTKLVRQILDWCMNDEKEFSPTKVTVRSGTGDDGFREMIQQLGGLPTLEELYLRSTGISDTGMQLVSDLRWLHTLSVIKGPISDAGLTCLESLCDLKSLCLAEVNVTDDGLRHVKPLQKLELLWLNETKVSDAGLEDIAGLKNLWYIDLSDTLVTAEGRQHLRGILASAQVLPD
jgi:hypothetical protein